MTPDEHLRQLKVHTEQRRRDFNDALARARAMKEMYDRDLARLAQEFGLESVGDAQEYITQKEAEIAARLTALSEQLA